MRRGCTIDTGGAVFRAGSKRSKLHRSLCMTMDADDPVDLLLVDDRPADLLLLSQILSGSEYRLQPARSANEALRCLLERDFGVLLLDVIMPTMDGFELAKMIKQRRRNQDTPIIFLTAGDRDSEQVYRGYSVGAIDYLTKPVDPDLVRAKVAILADLFRKDRRLKRQAEALRQSERRERKLMISRLELEAERRYVNLAEAIPLSVWTADPAGHLSYANRHWVDYVGRALADAGGTAWLGAVHESERGECSRAWRAAVAGGTPFEFECRLLRKRDGVYRWHLLRAFPERAERGELLSWVGTHSDIEDSKQAILARDEFLSIASHELRTPLTALELRLQTVLRTKDLPAKAQQRIARAQYQVQRLERLMKNLLDVSRIEATQLELELESMDLAELVRDLVERFREQAMAAGVMVELEAHEAAVGRWDRSRLEQVLTNLLSNALRYGEGKPIRVRVCREIARIRVAVEDQGSGIAPQDIVRIFRQFERVGGRRALGGLGIGLYIARKIVEAHAGTVEVESVPGKGSTFHVLLPCQ